MVSNRRGIALLAALWLVGAIATVALALSLEARAHRVIGLAAADRTAARAAAAGGLAIARARLEQVVRQPRRATGSNVDRLRASDPWLDPDSLFPDTLRLGNVLVRLHAEDLQSKLDINSVSMLQLRTFLSFVLRDYQTADALAQAIDDWRDPDDLPQPRGAERKEYLAHRRLDLPGNRGFRTVDELRLVEGMTPALFARIRPYLRTQGDVQINVNSAPPPVLRAIPGMTDAVATRILAVRSQHQRITSADELLAAGMQTDANTLQALVTFTTTQLDLTITASLPPPAQPLQVGAFLQLTNSQAQVRRL